MSKPVDSSAPSPLLTAPVPLMLRKIAIPVTIGTFFNSMYNIVDTFYGGLISDQALAALTLSFPIYFILIAVGFGFAQGTTALIGNSLGRSDMEQAEQRAMQTIVFGVINGLLLTVLVRLVSPTLVELMGATDPEYKAMTLAYIDTIFSGAVFFIVLAMMQSVLNALGDTIPGRNVLVGGFFLNLILDPWFIFGGFGLPAMGIRGIALATVLVQLLGCIYITYILSKTDLLSADSIRKYWKPDWRVFGRILEQGAPTALDTLGISLGFFVLNYYVAQFGIKPVAAIGAAGRLEQIALLPILGLNVGVLALVARNNGAKNYARVQETYRTAIKYGIIIMLTTMVIVSGLARPLMGIFSDDPEIINIGTQYTQIRNLGLVPNALFFVGTSAMRGIERPYMPLVLNILRFVGLPWLFIIIFVKGLGYGLTSIWVTSTAAFFIVAAIMYVITERALPKPTA